MKSIIREVESVDEKERSVEKWAPPPAKRQALQISNGEPSHCPALIDENMTIITTPKTLLRHHQPELVQYINLESLVPYLNQQQLLTDDENDTLLNLYLSNRIRVIKLLQFMETKGDEGFQRFLKAIAYEQDHMGHAEIAKLLAPYRCAIPNKEKALSSMQSVVNTVALHASMQPIQGAEFDLELGGPIQGAEFGLELGGPITGTDIPETMAAGSECPAPSGAQAKAEKSESSASTSAQESESSTSTSAQESEDSDEIDEIRDLLQNDSPDETCTRVIRKYPNLTFPSGPLRLRSNSLIYTSLFKMAWGGDEMKARRAMRYLRRSNEVSVDIKIVSMEVVHTDNSDKDLKLLTSALAFTDRPTCENKSILKCRLHRRIAGLHYRNNDLEEANEHMDTALQLAHNIGPDIDTIYTNRLKALMLFEDYKKTKSRDSYRDANKFFTKAMDHARQQPESKRIVTERVKVSKALFHLDMWEEYRKEEGEVGHVLMELECRAQDTLEDVDEDFLTDGDRAFLYLTRAKLSVCGEDWEEARKEAQRALELNQRCGLEKRTKQAEELLAHIPSPSNTL